MVEAILSRLRVLDLSHYIAGPYCTRFLSGLGAEVIKVERPGGGDPARRLGPFPDDIPHSEKSGLFLYLNTAKKGVTLNLKTETGKRIFRELIKDADVLVENFAPRVMPSLGLAYEELARINPRLVMTSISNFGQSGPYRDYKAQEISFGALGGLMYMTGDPDKEPLKEPGNTIQLVAGANAAAATLAACYEQKRSGSGQHVDISILESVVALLDVYTLIWNRTKLVMKRQGNHAPTGNLPGAMADVGIYPCQDGYIGITIKGLDDLALVAEMTGVEDLVDPVMSDGYTRYVHRDRLQQLLEKALRNQGKDQLFLAAQKVRLLWGSVRNVAEVMTSAHYKERGFWTEIDHPAAGRQTYPRLPFLMSAAPSITGRAPLLGEHNMEVYRDRLGYAPADVVRLRQADVI